MSRISRLPPPPEKPVRSPPVAVAGEEAARIGTLDARVHVPAKATRAVVICHPHPLYGGSMNSPVPLAIAKVLSDKVADTVAWARFDFRGVGASGGAYDEGRGEVDDARAVIAHMRDAAPGVPIAVCGHSFGSWVGLRAAGLESGVDRCLLVAPSVRFFEWPAASGGDLALRRGGQADAFVFAGEKTIFIGDRDEFCDVSEATELARRLGAKLRVFEGFDHHFMKSRRFMAEAALPVLVPA